MRTLLAGLLFATLSALSLSPSHAQTAPAPVVHASEALRARIDALPAILRGEGDYDAYFAPAFRAQVPKEKLAATNAQIVASYGPLTGIQDVVPTSPWTATLSIVFRDGVGAARIAVDPEGTHQVTGLLITGFTARAPTLAAVTEAIRALPGSTGFALARLGDGAPQIIASHNPDRALGVGSAFKLVILAELVRETNAGTRKWSDMVTIDGTPLPGGTYTLMPKGSQFSLSDIAGRMISISDNSATDILLRLVGREKAEAMMKTLGVADPARNRPYLGALELFKLKGVAGLADKYLALDEAGRRNMLATEVAETPVTAISPTLFKDGKPIRIDSLEWFFTPADLVRIMDWLRRNTATEAGSEARRILAINPALPPASAGAWAYVGYKGGSEPGVLNLTWLLESKDHRWFVLTGSWNNPDAEVDLPRFLGLLARAADLSVPTRP